MGLRDVDDSQTTNDGVPPPRAAVRPHEEARSYVGDVVAGKYRVERVLGTGGMAIVVSAKHVQLDEHFALKFLNRQYSRHTDIVERFMREAKAACKIRSEHVARVYDAGTHEGAPYLVMEHLVGRDLATVLAESGPLHIEDAVEYTMQACEALAVAHSHGIVHRDIKPENLFLVEHEGLPKIKLLDFGISKVALTGGDYDANLTGNLSLGTPCYMAPEHIRSTAAADARSDLWSLGVVLYELLAGIEAFQAASVTEVCAAVLETEPTPVCELRPEVPEELACIVERCMQKDPAERFADVAELAAALLPFAPSRALVSAERSSSILAAARPTLGGDPPCSSIRLRSSTPAAARTTPSSRAPLARSIAPSIEADTAVEGLLVRRKTKRTRRIWGRLALTAVVATVAAFGLVTFRAQSRDEHAAEPRAIAASAADAELTVAMPITTRPPAALATNAGLAPSATTRLEAPSAKAAAFAAAASESILRAPTASASAPKRPAVPRAAAPAKSGAPREALGARSADPLGSAAAPTALSAPSPVELGY